jgi:hypothetical protein
MVNHGYELRNESCKNPGIKEKLVKMNNPMTSWRVVQVVSKGSGSMFDSAFKTRKLIIIIIKGNKTNKIFFC